MIRALFLALCLLAAPSWAQSYLAITTPSQIAVNVSPSRTSCTAPCAVFFNASATTASSLTSRPYHHLHYAWNFGDSGAGAWTYGTRTGASSKNVAYGPIAAHVFDTADTYSVTLTVTHGANTASGGATITVTAADTTWSSNTLCIKTDSTPSGGADGCPTGATGLQSSDFDAAINSNIATGCGGSGCRRFLFRAGQTFTSSTSANLNVAGPGLVGAYGSGAKPLINGNGAKFLLSQSDWRIAGLNLDGVNDSGEAVGISDPSNPQNTLVYQNTITNFNDTLHFPDFKSSVQPPLYQYTFFVENDISSSQQYAFIGDGSGMAFLGNRMNDNAAQHLVRTNFCERCIHSNNEYGSTGIGLRLTVRAFGSFTAGNGDHPAGTSYTEKILISENYFPGGAVTVRCTNDTDDCRIRNVIFESNYSAGGLTTEAGDFTIRNNLFTLAGSANVLLVAKPNNVNIPSTMNDNIEVFNNSVYNGSSASGFNFILLSSGSFLPTPANFRLQNNLAYMPSITATRLMLNGTLGANETVSNNTGGCTTSDCAAMSTCDPSFVSTPPGATFTNWQADDATCVVDEGTSVPVWRDFFQALRAGTYDLGAVNP